MLKRILQLASTLVFVLSGSLVWGQTQGGSGGAVYGMDTIKEVTSIAKLNGVCLEDLTNGTMENISAEQQSRCSCVSFQLEQSLSFLEYREIERNIFFGKKHWTDSDAIRRVRPHLREACNWQG